MHRLLAAAACLIPALAAADCGQPTSPLWRMNPNAVVEQPDPPAITAVSARAVIDVDSPDGCFDDACGDRSYVELHIAVPTEGRFGYQVQILGNPKAPPAFPEGPLEPFEAISPAVVRVPWSSDDQYQSAAVQVQIRSVNLKGDPGPWIGPVALTPAPLDSRAAGGNAWLLALLAVARLATRRRRQVTA
ncbi:MAG: hypothetical protein KC549_05175 [Myxococcales bacterium]|nr:hypothetical protein [Myxococcales bacterium]MCB9550116.1 hypothetical protein [Myxococcales bacterium]